MNTIITILSYAVAIAGGAAAMWFILKPKINSVLSHWNQTINLLGETERKFKAYRERAEREIETTRRMYAQKAEQLKSEVNAARSLLSKKKK